MSFVVSIVPSLTDRLLERNSAGESGLPNTVTVTDGPGVTGNPGNRLIFGADDPDEQIVQASSGVQGWAHSTGTARDEEGDLICTAMAWNGNPTDAGQKKARTEAYAIAGAVAQDLLADYTLGGLEGLLWALFGGQLDLTYRLDEKGVTAVLVFRIHYKARI